MSRQFFYSNKGLNPTGKIHPLQVSGLDFFSNGDITKHRCITAFTMWQDAINNEWGKVEDYVGWGLGYGYTDYRVFGCWGNTNFNPLHVPGSYDVLYDLEQRLNIYGARITLTAFTDQVSGSPVLMTPSEREAHFIHCSSIMAISKTGKLEVCNEYRKNWPEPYPLPFDRNDFQGVVGAISTWYDGHDPQEMGVNVDFVTKHTGGFDDEWSRKSKVCVEAQTGQGGGLGGYPPAWKPCIVGETCRIAEGSLPHEHEADTAIQEAMGSGGCRHGGFHANIHDSLLQRCIIPTNPQALACIRSASSAFNGIPGYVAGTWTYSNAGGGVLLHDDNLMLRTYAMKNGNRAYVIRVKGRKKGMGITTIDDWKVINKHGIDETIVYCER